MSDDEDREARAFREAMRGVRRLSRGGKAERVAPKPPAKARFTRADQVEVLRESLLPPADEAVLGTGDEVSFRRPHISEAVLTKLRRGAYVVDGEIDLHGMTGAEAKAALRKFITECVEQRLNRIPFQLERCLVHDEARRDRRNFFDRAEAVSLERVARAHEIHDRFREPDERRKLH